MSETKASSGLRIIEILLGLIALVIGVLVLVYPGMTTATIIILLAIALLIIGLFRFFWGFGARNVSGSARSTAILIGIVAVIIAVLILVFPVFATGTAVILIDIGILVYAIGRIAIGLSAGGNESMGLRSLQIIAGVFLLIIGTVVLIYPGLGAAFLGFLLGIAFLIIGFEGIAAGIVGTKYIPPVPDVALEP